MRATDWDNIPGFDPEKQAFVRLDTDRWLKNNGILDEARKQGAQNKPGPEQREQRTEGIPAKIRAWINERGRSCRQDVSRHLSDLMGELADMENPEELRILRQTVDESQREAEIALERDLNKGRNDLSTLEKDLREAEIDFEGFRRENCLRRLPDYSYRKKALRWVIGFFVVELILNAGMLADVNAYGLLGSSSQMALIGAVNVLIFAWVTGSLVRLMAHVNLALKIVGGMLVAVIAGVVAVFNAWVGHFRDSMQAVLGDTAFDLTSLGADTAERFASGVVAFDSFQSGLLALLGFLFFAAASQKWWQRDDRYPGYGGRHRQLQETRDRYVKRFSETQQALQETFDKYHKGLEDVRHGLVAKQSRWRSHRDQGERLVEDFSINLAQYQHDLEELLGAYYTANRSRRTEQAPAWFSERIEVDPEILVPPSFNVPELTSIQTVTDRVDEAIIALQDQFKDSIRQFPSLDSVLTKPVGGAEKAQ